MNIEIFFYIQSINFLLKEKEFFSKPISYFTIYSKKLFSVKLRIFKINKLLKKEINDILRKKFQSEAKNITVVKVITYSDLKQAKIYYSILNEEKLDYVKRFFSNSGIKIVNEVNSKIKFKYFLLLKFTHDGSTKKFIDFIKKINEIYDPRK